VVTSVPRMASQGEISLPLPIPDTFIHKPFPQRRGTTSRRCEFGNFPPSCRLLKHFIQGICATRLVEMVFLHQPVCRTHLSGCLYSALTVVSRPTGGVAAVILFIFLNLNPHQPRPIRDELVELDFIGLFCLVGGVICLFLAHMIFDLSQISCEREI